MKKIKEIKKNYERGITLVALVITIVILIILSTITINATFGEEGLIHRAQRTKEITEQAILNEQESMNTLMEDFEDIINGTRPTKPSIKLLGTKGDNDIYTSNVTATISMEAGEEEKFKIHYTVTGAKELEEQISDGTVSIEIAEEGETTITAWVENENGKESDKTVVSFIISKIKVLTKEELELSIGKYVNYVPETSSFLSEEQYNGEEDLSFTTELDAKWRILFVKNDKLSLISAKEVNTGFTLRHGDGYNNAVLLLNNACNTMYSNSDWAIARSIKIEDIESQSTFNKQNYVDSYGIAYGSEYAPESGRRYYPSIFAQEVGGAVNGTYTGILEQSEQDNYETGGILNGGTQFKGKHTSYSFDMSESTMKSQIYAELFTSTAEAWIATRCVNHNTVNDCLLYKVYYTNGNKVNHETLVASYTRVAGYDKSYALRPIVEIDLNQVDILATGNGEENTPYGINIK